MGYHRSDEERHLQAAMDEIEAICARLGWCGLGVEEETGTDPAPIVSVTIGPCREMSRLMSAQWHRLEVGIIYWTAESEEANEADDGGATTCESSIRGVA